MTTQTTCPDCGGIIGGERTGADFPCRCPITPPHASLASDDTIDEREGESSAGRKGKFCVQCKKPLEGHRRFKDSVGYWCKDCHRKDKAQHKAPETRCPDCGRLRPIESMITFEGRSICPPCHKEAMVVVKRKANKLAAEEAHKAHERRNLYIMLGVFAFLLAIVAFSLIRKHLHH